MIMAVGLVQAVPAPYKGWPSTFGFLFVSSRAAGDGKKKEERSRGRPTRWGGKWIPLGNGDQTARMAS